MSEAHFHRIGKRDLWTVNRRALWNLFILGFFCGAVFMSLLFFIILNII